MTELQAEKQNRGTNNDGEMYVLAPGFSKQYINKLIDKYCEEYHISEGHKDFLKKIPFKVWKLQLPNCNLDAMDLNTKQYDFREYFKRFLDNPALPQDILRSPKKYIHLKNASTNYKIYTYKKGIYNYAGGYWWISYYEYGYGVLMQGDHRVYLVDAFPNIKDRNKQLQRKESYYYTDSTSIECYGEYDTYRELVWDQPAFGGTQKDLTAVLHKLGLKNKTAY